MLTGEMSRVVLFDLFYHIAHANYTYIIHALLFYSDSQ
jgi:hypothetical protein